MASTETGPKPFIDSIGAPGGDVDADGTVGTAGSALTDPAEAAETLSRTNAA